MDTNKTFSIRVKKKKISGRYSTISAVQDDCDCKPLRQTCLMFNRWDKKKKELVLTSCSDYIHVRDYVGHHYGNKGCILRGNTTLCLPGLQLSVFIFLRAVVALLGLLGQLPAVLGFIIRVSSALRVCWPVGNLRLGIRAGPEHTHTHVHTKQWCDVHIETWFYVA